MITIIVKIWGKPSLWEKRPVGNKKRLSLLCEEEAKLVPTVAMK
jgi:hypothetical protein